MRKVIGGMSVSLEVKIEGREGTQIGWSAVG
jgi:hypothetical protein